MSNFIKICPVGTELFHVTDGQTDMTRLIDAFRDFAKASRDALVNPRDQQRLMIQCLPVSKCLESSCAYKIFVLQPT